MSAISERGKALFSLVVELLKVKVRGKGCGVSGEKGERRKIGVDAR